MVVTLFNFIHARFIHQVTDKTALDKFIVHKILQQMCSIISNNFWHLIAWPVGRRVARITFSFQYKQWLSNYINVINSSLVYITMLPNTIVATQPVNPDVYSGCFHYWRLGCSFGTGRRVSHSDTKMSTLSRKGTTKMPCNRQSQPIEIHHICCTAKELSFSNESFHFNVYTFTKLQRHFLRFGHFFFSSLLISR